MMARHPETALAPYVAGDLPPAERAEIAAHLERCPACHEIADAFRALLDDLATTTTPPPLDAARYTADLRRKLAARTTDRPARPAWRWRPVPLALSAALVSVLVFVAVKGAVLDARLGDLTVVDEAVLGERLDLVRQHPMLETLDLLEQEDLDVIRHLDRLAESREGSTPPPRDG